MVLERVDPGVPTIAAGTGGSSAFAVAQQRRRRRYNLRGASAATTKKTSTHAASSTATTSQATQAISQWRVTIERGVRGRLTYRHREEEVLKKVSVLSSYLEWCSSERQYLWNTRKNLRDFRENENCDYRSLNRWSRFARARVSWYSITNCWFLRSTCNVACRIIRDRGSLICDRNWWSNRSVG